jgi:hypothetical protein
MQAVHINLISIMISSVAVHLYLSLAERAAESAIKHFAAARS